MQIIKFFLLILLSQLGASQVASADVISSASFQLHLLSRARQVLPISSASFALGEGFLNGRYGVSQPILAPLVLGIIPNTGVNTGSINITNLAGANFAAGAVVKLSKSGQADITASSVVVDSSSKISCVFDLTGAQPGFWSVTVANSDGQSGSLPNAFNIEAPELIIQKPVSSTKNPYNPASGPTAITYSLSKNADISIYIYNLRGERVWQYDAPAGSEGGKSGENSILWDGITGFKATVSSGVYIVHVVSRSNGQTKIISRVKIAIVK